MRIHFRGDNMTPAHIRFTVFLNGASCGHLCMRHDEASWFLMAIQRGTLDDPKSCVEVTGPWPITEAARG
jgi:hypothetical protein